MNRVRISTMRIVLVIIVVCGILISGCKQCGEQRKFAIKQTPTTDSEQVTMITTLLEQDQGVSRQAEGGKLQARTKTIGITEKNSALIVGIRNRSALHKPVESWQLAPEVAALLQEQSHLQNTLWIIENNSRMAGSN